MSKRALTRGPAKLPRHASLRGRGTVALSHRAVIRTAAISQMSDVSSPKFSVLFDSHTRATTPASRRLSYLLQRNSAGRATFTTSLAAARDTARVRFALTRRLAKAPGQRTDRVFGTHTVADPQTTPLQSS